MPMSGKCTIDPIRWHALELLVTILTCWSDHATPHQIHIALHHRILHPFMLLVVPLLLHLLLLLQVTERWIEGRHHLASQVFKISPRAGPVHLSFSTILPLIVKEVERDPEYLNILASKFDEVKNFHRAADALGFTMHPRLQELARDHSRRKDHLRKEFVKVLYHVDAFTLHGKLEQPVHTGAP